MTQPAVQRICRLCLAPESSTRPLEMIGRHLACLECAALVRGPVQDDSEVRERTRERSV